MKGDYQLIGRSFEDVIAEPYRAKLIPGFYQIKEAAMEAGALGCSISGAGPAMFSLCRGDETAFKVGIAMQQAFQKVSIKSERYISTINTLGAERIR